MTWRNLFSPFARRLVSIVIKSLLLFSSSFSSCLPLFLQNFHLLTINSAKSRSTEKIYQDIDKECARHINQRDRELKKLSIIFFQPWLKQDDLQLHSTLTKSFFHDLYYVQEILLVCKFFFL